MNEVAKPKAPALPASYEDMIAGRQMALKLSLNDHVDDLHLALWKDEPEKYLRLIEAVWDEESLEGSCAADDMVLAIMIRDKAKAMGNKFVEDKKLAAIAKSHRVVLKRYGLSRRQRRDSVKGETVSGNGE
jgi:hypothetical protein